MKKILIKAGKDAWRTMPDNDNSQKYANKLSHAAPVYIICDSGVKYTLDCGALVPTIPAAVLAEVPPPSHRKASTYAVILDTMQPGDLEFQAWLMGAEIEKALVKPVSGGAGSMAQYIYFGTRRALRRMVDTHFACGDTAWAKEVLATFRKAWRA